jgi:hypothetical protein
MFCCYFYCCCRPPDADPDGAKLAATADPLGEATKYVVALVQVRMLLFICFGCGAASASAAAAA